MGGCRSGWEPQHVLFEVLYRLFKVRQPGSFEALVSRGDELLYGRLVFFQFGVDVGFVEVAGALGLGEDEIEQETEADVAVEGDPELRNQDMLAKTV